MLGLTQIIFWDFYFLLFKARMEVEDLFVDLADGKKLLKLLEIISGEKLSKPNNGRMRVHKIENVNKSLAFLHTKVYSVIRKITKKKSFRSSTYSVLPWSNIIEVIRSDDTW